MRKKAKANQYNRNVMPISDDPAFKNFEFNPLVNSQLIIESFNIFDENRTDDLDRREFKKLMIALGSDMDDKQINELYNKVDTDKSGTIDLNEFNSMMLTHNFNKNTPVQYILEKCFDLYDKDNDGFIDKFDMQKVGDEFEDFTKIDELDILIRLIKEFAIEENILSNNDESKISKEEFLNAMIKIQFVREISKVKSTSKDNKDPDEDDN